MTSALFILASLLAMLVPATAAGAIAPGHTIGQYLYESEALLRQTIVEGPYGGVSICAGHGVCPRPLQLVFQGARHPQRRHTSGYLIHKPRSSS